MKRALHPQHGRRPGRLEVGGGIWGPLACRWCQLEDLRLGHSWGAGGGQWSLLLEAVLTIHTGGQ